MKIVKHIISLFLVLTMIASMAALTVAGATGLSADTKIEAEDGTLTKANEIYATEIVKEGTASGGKAIVFGGGYEGDGTRDPKNLSKPDLSFSFDIKNDGAYTLWALFRASSGSCDSVFWGYDDSSYENFSSGTTESLTWKKIGQTLFTKGTHTIDFKHREAGFVLDQIMLCSSDAISPVSNDDSPVIPTPATEGQKATAMTYPKIFDESLSNSIAPFADGDKVAFIGDSITHGGTYHSNILTYFATRYPNASFSVSNKGINGDVTSGILGRMNSDIFCDADGDFNKIVIMIGTNDMSRTEYFAGNELINGALSRRTKIMNGYKTNIKQIIDTLLGRGYAPSDLYIVTPPVFDEFLPESNKPASPGFNNIIREAGSWLCGICKEKGINFIDINTPQLIVTQYNNAKDSKFSIVSDRVHPDKRGHYIMSYTFLKAQGESGEVASVNIDATANKAEANGAKVELSSASDSAVEYEYTPFSLPLPADTDYVQSNSLFGLTDALNREIIKVSNLKSGVYTIEMDGKKVTDATDKDLAEGVNIATLSGNPSQLQSLALKQQIDLRLASEKKIRDFRATEKTIISKYKFDTSSYDVLLAAAKAKSSEVSGEDKTALDNYIISKQAEKSMIETVKSFDSKIYTMNKPNSIKVSIKYSKEFDEKESINIASTYVDASLSAETADIRSKQDGINVKVNRKFIYPDVAPVIIDDRTLVPMRAIFEALGANVSWDEASATATATKDSSEIKITENSKIAYINGAQNELDVTATILDGRFVVPVRFVSEALGARVSWDEDCEYVSVYTDNWVDITIPTEARKDIPNAILVKKVTQSGDDGAGNSIENSIDTSLNTRWAPEGDDGSAWGIFDLGEEYPIDKVMLAFYNGNTRTYHFELEASVDGVTYTPLLAKKSSSGKTNELETYDTDDVTARYIKYIGRGNSVNKWNSLTEIVFIKK